MSNLDFTPYRQSTIGFDRLFDLLETGRGGPTDGYPPFDIVKLSDDSYRITLAVAGFRPDEIEIIAQQNQVTVSAHRKPDDEKVQYVHRGITNRSCELKFQLAGFSFMPWRLVRRWDRHADSSLRR